MSDSFDLETLLTAVKDLESAELFKLLKAVAAEAEKKAKSGVKSASTKKAGSAPKGVAPPQLRKPRAWVEYTLKDAIENGWEAFEVSQTKKDKVSGEKSTEVVEMPGSVRNTDGAFVYEDSISDKSPLGRQINHKEAMSLSKFRKDNGHASWAAFEAQYVDEEPVAVAKPVEAPKSTVVRKTAAEKAAEAEAKKAAKEAEKEAKKAAKEAEKEAKKAAKEAEKEAKKAAKEAEKEAKKAAKEAEKAAKATTKVAAPKAPAKKAAAVPKAPVKPAAPAKPVAKVEDVAIPEDGNAHPWVWKGKNYLRTSDNEVWLAKADGSLGKWQGKYDPVEDKIDDSVEEPSFEDDDE